MMDPSSCRFCGEELRSTFVDLGMSPLSNAYLTARDLDSMEPFYPLHIRVCEGCFLVQLPEFEPPERIFNDYAYFSSYSDGWLDHARTYTERMIERFGVNESWQVVELASNDGYLLQYFKAQGIPVLGVEPAGNVAKMAEQKGIPTQVAFFGVKTAEAMVKDGIQADLLIGNNVLAHVPDLNDFVAGMKRLLAPQGVLTMEFPHLLRLMQETQFDTIYHEHFSYFSFLTAQRVFTYHGLVVFDVEELPTHGGSLRVYVRHAEDRNERIEERVRSLMGKELSAGLDRLGTYAGFSDKVQRVKRNLLRFLIEAKEQGKTVVGYGAPAKGNTLLNYCGIRTDFLDYTVDRSPHKQGRFLPGTHIPIYPPDRIRETRPDYLLILPWNIKDEILEQMACIREWGGRFIVPIPEVCIIS